MIKLCETLNCTGCMSCYNKCPVSAITMAEDEEGFQRPLIDENICIECGACQNVCPVLHKATAYEFPKEVYACWSKDNEIRSCSTSGGIFSELANYVFEHDGIVYGVRLQEDGKKAFHFRGTDKNALCEMRGSKYVQSDVGNSFQDVYRDLSEEKLVLFSGTPCQIAGLRKYLGKEYPNLICCDLVCHGVPSPKIYQDYLEYMEKKYNDKPQKIWFRDKSKGWEEFCMKIQFHNGKIYKNSTYKDYYIRGFLRNLYLRPSCHECAYTSTDRVSDLTIADFWGYRRESWKARDTDEGISMCMINSEKGKNIYDCISNRMVSYKKTVEEAVAGNQCLNRCFEASPLRKDFWRDYHQYGYTYVAEKYCYPEKRPLKQQLQGSRLGIEYGYLKRWVKKKIKKK